MNKLISKIVGACLGLSLATGVGVGVAVGQNSIQEAKAADSTVTYIVPDNSAFGSGETASGITGTFTDDGGFIWNYTRTLESGVAYTGSINNGYLQLGKNGGVDNFIFSTSAISGTIKSVSINCASYQGKHNVSIKVGSNTYLASTAVPTWSNNNGGTKTGTGSSSGTITISITDGTRAFYFKSISVTYESSGPSYPEPTMVTGTLSQLFANTDGNGKQLYQVTGYVSKWQGSNTNGTKYGNFYLKESADSTTEYLIYGATQDATKLAWNSGTGVYNFTNPENFLTGSLTSTIAIGDEVTMKLTRCDYNSTPEAQGIVTNVVKHSTEYEEPTMVTGTLSQLFANTDGNGKQLYQITGYVSNWYGDNTDGTKYGNFYLTETLGGTTEYYIYGATSDSTKLVWNATTGVYNLSNPQTFLTDSVTRTITIGSKVTMKLTRCDYQSTPEAQGIVLSVDNSEIPVSNDIIIEPAYLGLPSELTQQTTLTGSDGMEYVTAPSSSSKKVKPQDISSSAVNAFDSSKKAILLGENGAYIYNNTAFSKKISSLQVYSNKGASTSVKVAVEFATEASGALTTSIDSSTNVKTLSTADSVYDYSLSGMLTANYRFFRLQIVSAHNAQVQIKVSLADDDQQAINLNSITLSHTDLVDGTLPIGKGASKTLSVSFDPTDASDKTLTWSTSNDQIATVDNGVITISKTAALNSTATITATPIDTHASAKSITVKVVDAVVKTVDMRNGIDNSADNRLQLTTSQGLSSWPNNAIKVTLTDDSELYPSYNDSKIVWYYNTSDSGTNDIQIDDIASFVFNTSIKRMRLSYDGVLATARTFVTVVEASSDASDFADLFLETLSTGNNATCNAQGNTNLDTLKSDWETLAGMFDALSDGDKTLFTDGQGNETGTNIQKALALYDYIASKYNTQLETETLTDYNFMGRTLSSGARPMINNFNVSNNVAVISVMVVITLVTVSAGAYFLLRKKKEN